jgi:hypothetical protein
MQQVSLVEFAAETIGVLPPNLVSVGSGTLALELGRWEYTEGPDRTVEGLDVGTNLRIVGFQSHRFVEKFTGCLGIISSDIPARDRLSCKQGRTHLGTRSSFQGAGAEALAIDEILRDQRMMCEVEERQGLLGPELDGRPEVLE